MASTLQDVPSATPVPARALDSKTQLNPVLPPKRSRSQIVRRWVICGTLSVVLLAGLALSLPHLVGGSGSEAAAKAITLPISRSNMVVTVTDNGDVESRANTEVKCKIPGGSNITWIVDDGSVVAEGDVIVRLDESKIEEALDLQKIAYTKALATKIQAEQEFLAAKIAVQEYEEGTFLNDVQTAEAAIIVAQEGLRSAENMLLHTERMARKGYATPLQREAQEFAVQRAQLDLKTATMAKSVLEKFTKQKMLTELVSKQFAGEAKVESEKAGFNLEQSRMERLEERLRNCTIKAPHAGMVIFANDMGLGRTQTGPKIEPGAIVHDQQTLIRLPDLTQMQVRVTVHESKVDRIKPGMPARIRILDRDLSGTVIGLGNQPEPTAWFASSVKEYATFVRIDDAAEDLKPGMTAEVEILISEAENVLTVPVQAVIEKHDEYFCWIQTSRGQTERRELRIGESNDKVLEVKDGLLDGDVVVLNPLTAVAEANEGLRGPANDDETMEKFHDQKRRAKAQAAAAIKTSAMANPPKPAAKEAASGREKPASGPNAPAADAPAKSGGNAEIAATGTPRKRPVDSSSEGDSR